MWSQQIKRFFNEEKYVSFGSQQNQTIEHIKALYDGGGVVIAKIDSCIIQYKTTEKVGLYTNNILKVTALKFRIIIILDKEMD